MARRVARYRGRRPPLALRGRAAIVVDDGLATGLTDLAAVRAVRKRDADPIVLAVPVGTSEALELLAQEADEVVCLQVPKVLHSVGSWYRDFAPVTDGQVLDLLAVASSTTPAPAEE
jgi:putative phosphoribosyl transferase